MANNTTEIIIDYCAFGTILIGLLVSLYQLIENDSVKKRAVYKWIMIILFAVGAVLSFFSTHSNNEAQKKLQQTADSIIEQNEQYLTNYNSLYKKSDSTQVLLGKVYVELKEKYNAKVVVTPEGNIDIIEAITAIVEKKYPTYIKERTLIDIRDRSKNKCVIIYKSDFTPLSAFNDLVSFIKSKGYLISSYRQSYSQPFSGIEVYAPENVLDEGCAVVYAGAAD